MSHRFFLNSPPNGPTVCLDGDQAHHAIQVMRFKIGDEVILFDGTGVEHVAIIDQIAKKHLELTIIESVTRPRSLTATISIAVALPKGDRQKFLIEKLVELGIHRLIPLSTNRSVAVANDKVILRLQKQVIEASKQCGRNRLMEIGRPQTIQQVADSINEPTVRLIANPYEGKVISSYRGTDSASRQPIVVIVGPEGGLDDSENELAAELGFQPVRLGATILRVETAAIAIAAILGIGFDRIAED